MGSDKGASPSVLPVATASPSPDGVTAPVADLPTGDPAPVEPSGGVFFRNSFLVGSLLGASRLLGLLRDVLIAVLLGVSVVTDALFICLSLAQMLRGIFLEGNLAQSLVASFTRLRTTLGTVPMRALFGRLVLWSSIFLPISLLGATFGTGLVQLFAPGFVANTERMAVVTPLLQGAMLYLWPLLVLGLAAAAQNACRHFLPPASAALLFNIGFIFVLLAAATGGDEPDVILLAWAVPLAGLLQLVAQLWFLRRSALLPRFTTPPAGEPATTLRIAAPALLTVLLLQIHIPLNNVIASFLPIGGLSWVSYATRLSLLVPGLIGVALSVVLLPELARHHARNDHRGYGDVLLRAALAAWFIGLPAGAALYCLAEPITFTLFQYGHFEPADAVAISLGVAAAAFGVPALVLAVILNSAFLGVGDTRTPLRIGLGLLPLALLLKVVLVLWLERRSGIGYMGFMISGSVVAWLHALWLALALYRTGWCELPLAHYGRRAWRALPATLAMLLALAALGAVGINWEALEGLQRGLWLALSCAAGLISYFVALWLSGERFAAWRDA